jgi:hypothetical protein
MAYVQYCEGCREHIEPHDGRFQPVNLCVRCYLDDESVEREVTVEFDEHFEEYRLETTIDHPQKVLRWSSSSLSFPDRAVAESWATAMGSQLTRALWLRFDVDREQMVVVVCCRTTEECERVVDLLQETPLGPLMDHELLPLAALVDRGIERRVAIELADWGLATRNRSHRVRFDDDTFGVTLRFDPNSRFEPLLVALEEELEARVDFDTIDTVAKAEAADGGHFGIAARVVPALDRAVSSYVRRNLDVLSEQSRRIVLANRRGQSFEDSFEQRVADAGVEFVRSVLTLKAFDETVHVNADYRDWDYPALCEAVPDALESLFDGHTTNTPPTGLPDYFVYGEQGDVEAFLSGLGDDEETVSLSHAGAFVEVKHTTSKDGRVHINDNQRNFIPKLTDAGADVFFYKGTLDGTELRRSWLTARE